MIRQKDHLRLLYERLFIPLTIGKILILAQPLKIAPFEPSLLFM